MSARKSERIQCQYFSWRLRRRGRVFFADGRPTLDRFSLNTTDIDEARRSLVRLDEHKAVERGLATPSFSLTPKTELSLSAGRKLYEEWTHRPPVAGGPRESTRKRYRAVLDNFLAFAQRESVTTWNEVNARLLHRYAATLDKNDRAYRTQSLELTTIKQVVKHLVHVQRLPAEHLIRLPIPKAEGTSTYCYRRVEVEAMVERCRSADRLQWLAHVVVGLACTGLRISELLALRWGDIDLNRATLTANDESTHGMHHGRQPPRTTKSRRTRSFPLHESLLATLKSIQRSEGRIFVGPQGGRLKPDDVRKRLVKDVITPLAARFPSVDGVEGFAQARLHSFRHYFASQCANDGVPMLVVMRWLGHSSSRMVQHYYHLHDEEAQRQMQRVQFLSPAATRSVGERFSDQEDTAVE